MLKPKKNSAKKPLAFVSILFGLLIIPFAVHALSISPTIKEYELGAGQSVKGKVTIYNNEKQAVSVVVSTKNFEAGSEQGQPKFTDMTDDLASWIAVDIKNFELGQGQSRQIPYTITVPANAPPGGHFAGILFEEKPVTASKEGVDIGNQIGSLILLRVPGAVNELGSVKEFFIEDQTTDPLKINFAVRFLNSGNVFLKPYGTITVRDWLGTKVATVSVNDNGGNVLPQSGRKFNAVWQDASAAGGIKKIFFGRYTATLEMFYGTANKKEVMKINFWLINRAGTVTAIIALLAAVFIGRIIMKNIRRKRFFVERI